MVYHVVLRVPPMRLLNLTPFSSDFWKRQIMAGQPTPL